MDKTFVFPHVKDEEQASCLTSLEKMYPIKVLEDFFTATSIEEARTSLRSWLMASFQANNGEQFRYIHLWQQMERLIEASLLLCEQDRKTEERPE